MKKQISYFGAVLLGACLVLPFVSAQSPVAAQFAVTVTAKGEVEMECTEGCAWTRLTWTCDENDLEVACTVPVDARGTRSQ